LLKDYAYPPGNNGDAATATVNNVVLAAGDTLRLVGTVNGGALARVDKIVLTPVAAAPAPAPLPPVVSPAPTPAPATPPAPVYTGTPYSGSPIALPASFPAKNFDKGGEGVAYHDLTKGNAGALYRTGEDVDIAASADAASGGHMINSIQTGEWLAYSVNVPVAGKYDVSIRAASNYATPTSFHIEIDGANVSGPISVPKTGGWDSWQWIGKQGIPIAAGRHVLKIVADQQYFNLNSVSVLASAATPTPTPAPTPTPNPTPTPTPAPTASLPTAGKAVPTFESVGLYWTPPANPGAAGCEVRYRKSGTASSSSTWNAGLPMWYDARNNECRGSLVMLTPGTGYEVQFNMPGKAPVAQLTTKTWSESFPIAKTVHLTNGTIPTLNITEGGTASGYVLYTFPPGGQTTIDGANAQAHNVTISAPYVIVRGLTMKGAKQDAVRLLAGARDVVIEDNDISGWGRYSHSNSAGWQIGIDGDAGVRCESQQALERAIIQRNAIHHPRYGANSWSWGHPAGPQAVTFNYCGGNHVIRHNDIYSSAKQYFNDGIGGADNFTSTGFPNYDTDIYGNKISHAWDDAIEAEGGNRNVRIWGNYMDQTATGIATTVAHWGPVYIFRNVYNRSRQLSESAPDSDDRNVFAKSGSGNGYGNGRRYVFHNTTLQAPPLPGSTLTQGVGTGLYGPNSGQTLTNTVSRNNIWHIWKPHWASIDEAGGSGNDLDYDLFNGNVNAYRGAETNGIIGTPIYQPGNGWSSEANGMYQLAPASPGFDRGAKLPNFNDGFLGAGPDMGAHETGSPAMKFGVKAGTKP
jgi:hypothetical protein